MVRNKLKNMALSLAVIMGMGMASPVFAKSDRSEERRVG